MKGLLYSLFATFLFFVQCTTVRFKDISGNYYKRYHPKRGYDQVISLVLRKDSVFILSDKWFEVNSQCTGNWSWVSNDTIVLKCFDEKFPAQISSGYINDRVRKVIILGKSKLKLDNSVLKRVK